MENNKVVLAFSGGLDTSFCVKYLSEDKGLEVHSVVVNTGGFDAEEIKRIEDRAKSLGVKSHKTIDETDNYYEKVVRFLIFGNILKNGSYPLSVSAERVSQAVAIAQYAKEVGAKAIAHGSTGAGNDQVRFDMIFQTFMPEAEIITPIRDMQLSREAEIEYLQSKGVDWDFTKSVYSINKGLWGTSVGGKETLKSNGNLPESAFPTQVTKTAAEELKLTFEKGEIKAINDKAYHKPAEAILALEKIAGPFGIGRDIHVGDTIIGIKGRVGFEAAASVLLIKSHQALEKHVLSKWQIYWKDQVSAFYGNWLHEGQFMDPVMRDLEAMLKSTQRNVSGDVFLTLFPYRYQVNGIESAHDLMSAKFGHYGEMNKSWTGDDVRGFAKIFGNQNAIYHQVNEEEI
ncbi:argininosuccinate synthase [Roseivirga spongicola]|uniref:argininosuccinate synthase n=1 Tax=Roseivirga spongicola TaxID=333140 RepID=A0A150XGL1_9BACT|nr:argininosuccinate synthase [Roseivirga spongicola]KYG77842.1 argininosuccinate synthase [Roseivirga spongicola]WPZ11570.1 argininosuccinate synthase [Roseivirga spongicola]